MKALLQQLVNGQSLSREQTVSAFETIMTGSASDVQIAAMLAALKAKGESVDEIIGAATVMRQKVTRIAASGDVIDTCGTGGDQSGTFNISTAAALVAAGAGAAIAKHGNRAATSRSGSAEVLAELGVNIDASTEVVSRCIEGAGIGFLFAPNLHPAMKYAGPVRKQLGIATIFNVLGPLTNPAGARRQLMGVYHEDLTEKIAWVLDGLASRRAWVVHGLDGLDELSTIGPTKVSELKDGVVNTFILKPEQFDLSTTTLEQLQVDGPADSAKLIREILEGKHGPQRDIVVFNAAAALVVAEKAEDLEAGIGLAAQAIDSGAAAVTLERLAEISAQS